MARLFRAVLVFAVALSGPLACGGEDRGAQSPLQYSQNAKRAYNEALKAYFDRDWETAVTLFEEVRRKYGYSRYARLSELRIADAAYRQENYAEAITGYKSFVHDYPNDPEVPYARFKIAKSQYQQAQPSLLLPPLEERDLAVVHDAYASIRGILADYPNYEHLKELEHMLEVVTGLLARHELYVARFYLNRDNFEAAVTRVQYALRNYEASGLEPEAMVLLGETYLKMKEREKARTAFRRVLAKYPDSPFVIPARKFLLLINR